MAKPKQIELLDGTVVAILHEDRAVLAIDKPTGWLLAPVSWDKTSRNLQLALMSSLRAGAFWARSRNLKYLRFAHRLDADASGVLLLAKSPGAVRAYSRLFESRQMEKKYLAAVEGVPDEKSWTCRLKVAPDPEQAGRMKIDARWGKDAETQFRVIDTANGRALVEARPVTGRTHQIRIHLAESGHPVLGDALYGARAGVSHRRSLITDHRFLALRAVALAFRDPFQRKFVGIAAPAGEFCREFGFAPDRSRPAARSAP